MTNSDKVYDLVSKIPSGKVLTYKAVANMVGIRNPRLVGSILHQNPHQDQTPCHRVVNSQGKLAQKFAFGGLFGQKKLLESEKILVENGRVDLSKYLWHL